jgi:hypothetical protein
MMEMHWMTSREDGSSKAVTMMVEMMRKTRTGTRKMRTSLLFMTLKYQAFPASAHYLCQVVSSHSVNPTNKRHLNILLQKKCWIKKNYVCITK